LQVQPLPYESQLAQSPEAQSLLLQQPFPAANLGSAAHAEPEAQEQKCPATQSVSAVQVVRHAVGPHT
jgi:hypothetical protein